ncbi:hypothetical protein GAYE_SCF22MG4136 [Galdieria yellowstonensis]|uniref:Uncharacterized protein n=1 Tax=Galdieria yellowstonensis TaxID=3028027 RepID=A0AAV9IFP3_9RHOD|nr:hypothetical protein GAYE_SCF22MG4136 [Galdieria yellowstonensis]
MRADEVPSDDELKTIFNIIKYIYYVVMKLKLIPALQKEEFPKDTTIIIKGKGADNYVKAVRMLTETKNQIIACDSSNYPTNRNCFILEVDFPNEKPKDLAYKLEEMVETLDEFTFSQEELNMFSPTNVS